jgi:hypothetical protein
MVLKFYKHKHWKYETLLKKQKKQLQVKKDEQLISGLVT